jgi:hypothetical protein
MKGVASIAPYAPVEATFRKRWLVERFQGGLSGVPKLMVRMFRKGLCFGMSFGMI